MRKQVPKRVKKQLLNIAFLVLLIAVTVIVIFTANDVSLSDIGDFLKGCNPWWIVGALGAMILSNLFEAVSIHFILRGLGERPRFVSSLCYTAADIYYSAITPSATGGQPAAVYYMVRDKIGAGKASFALVFNIAAYTASIIVIGIAAFALRPGFYALFDGGFPKFLVVIGFIIQGLLLAFFIGCMFCGGAVKKAGNALIGFLCKIRLVKKPDKWREKLAHEVEKYKSCLVAIKEHPALTFINFFCNLGQRLCRLATPCFVLLAAAPAADPVGLFACAAFIIIGYNSIPLPGGVGVYEYLYPNIYCAVFAHEADAFILSALMVSRAISYYLSMIACGVITLVYHVYGMRRGGGEDALRERGGTDAAEKDGGSEGDEGGGKPPVTVIISGENYEGEQGKKERDSAG